MEILAQEQKIFVFNSHPLRLGQNFPQPEKEDFPTIQFKYASLAHAHKNTTDYVRAILDTCSLQHNHKNVVVDIKVTIIEKGKPPCLPGWHCDTIIDPFNSTQPENHHLFVSGYASLTEFIAEPVTLEIPELKHQVMLHNLRRQLENKQFNIRQIPSCRVASYGRFDFHRGSLGLFFEKRLLIRVTETDVVTPQNHPFRG